MPVADRARRIALGFQPANALARMKAYAAGISDRIHQGNEQNKRILLLPQLEPVEGSLYVRSLAVEEFQAAQHLPVF